MTSGASRFLLARVIVSSKNCDSRFTAGVRCAGSSSRLTHVFGSFSSAQPTRLALASAVAKTHVRRAAPTRPLLPIPWIAFLTAIVPRSR